MENTAQPPRPGCATALQAAGGGVIYLWDESKAKGQLYHGSAGALWGRDCSTPDGGAGGAGSPRQPRLVSLGYTPGSDPRPEGTPLKDRAGLSELPAEQGPGGEGTQGSLQVGLSCGDTWHTVSWGHPWGTASRGKGHGFPAMPKGEPPFSPRPFLTRLLPKGGK